MPVRLPARGVRGITFPATERALHGALDELRGLEHVRDVSRVLRIYQ